MERNDSKTAPDSVENTDAEGKDKSDGTWISGIAYLLGIIFIGISIADQWGLTTELFGKPIVGKYSHWWILVLLVIGVLIVVIIIDSVVTSICEKSLNTIPEEQRNSDLSRAKNIIVDIAAVCGLVVLLVGGFMLTESKYITYAKECTPDKSEYRGITFEDAFDEFFLGVKWEDVGEGHDESFDVCEIVKFSGMYYNFENSKNEQADIFFSVKVKGDYVQSTIDKVVMDGTNMGLLGNVLIWRAFDEYKSNEIEGPWSLFQ